MSERHAFANRYLNRIRTICKDDSLQKNDVHKIFRAIGIEPIYGTDNRYNEYNTDRTVNSEYGVNKIKQAYYQLYIKPKEDMFKAQQAEEDEILDQMSQTDDNDERTNDAWRFNPNFGKTDMEKASYELLGNDDIYYDNHYPMLRESKNGKRIFLTEKQIEDIKEMLEENTCKFPVNPNKVKLVAKYLDDNFTRGGISTFSEDGYPTTICIVGMKGTDGQVAKNMDAKQLFYLLQDKFKSIYMDKTARDRFIKQVMKDWFNKKISKEGLLSVNLF